MKIEKQYNLKRIKIISGGAIVISYICFYTFKSKSNFYISFSINLN
jgi:hypothetical protein